MTLFGNLDQNYAAAAGAVAVTSAVLYYLTNKNPDPYASFPTPRGALPYIGHLASIDKLPGFKFKEWHDEFGPVLKIQMGVQPWIICSDQNILHTLLSTHGAVASSRPLLTFSGKYYAVGKKGILISDTTKQWKHLRTGLSSIASPANVKQFGIIHEKEADRVVEGLIGFCENGKSLNPTQRLNLASMNYVLQTCFGFRIGSEEEPLFKEITHFNEESMVLGAPLNDLGGTLPVLSIVDVLLGRAKMFKDFVKNVRDPLFTKLLQMAEDSDQDCLFKRLIQQQKELELDHHDLMVAAGDIVSGGTDSTTASLFTVLAILLQHPDTYQKLCDEVDVFIREHGRIPSFTERESLPLLNSVQKECFRYKPVALVSFFHVLDKDVECHGYVFPKGAWIMPSIYAMHRNPTVYPEPDKFIPERFLNDTKTMLSAANGRVEERDQFVFGFGRRICPGIHLAEVQMFNILTRVLAHCTLEPPASGVMPDLDDIRSAGFTATPPPYELRFVRRSDALLPLPK